MLIQVWRETAKATKYADTLVSDINTLSSKVGPAIKALEKLVINKNAPLNLNEVKRLDERTKAITMKFDELRGWAIRFGIIATQSKRQRKRE